MIGRLSESVESVGLVAWTDPMILVTIVVIVTLVAAIVFMLYLAFGVESEAEGFGPSFEGSVERLEGAAERGDESRSDLGTVSAQTGDTADRDDEEISESTEESGSKPGGD